MNVNARYNLRIRIGILANEIREEYTIAALRLDSLLAMGRTGLAVTAVRCRVAQLASEMTEADWRASRALTRIGLRR